MPLILDPLSHNNGSTRALGSQDLSMDGVVPSELMDVYEVSRLVHDPKNDSLECIEHAIPDPFPPLQ
jgi:hypothetical protein